MRVMVNERDYYEPLEFIGIYIIGLVYAFWFYNNTLFVNISGLTVYKSNLIILVVALVVFIINYNFVRRWNKNMFNIIFALSVPFLMYTVYTYYPYKSELMILLGIAFGIVGVILSAIVIFKKEAKRYKKKRLFRVKTRMVFCVWEKVVVYLFLALTLCILFRINFAGGLIASKVKATANGSINNSQYVQGLEGVKDISDETFIAENIDVLRPIVSISKWDELSLEQRLGVLQTILNHEADVLGFEDPIVIVSSILPRNTLGHTAIDERTIRISSDQLLEDGPKDCLITVYHEAMHVAQYYYVMEYEKVDEAHRNTYLMKNSKAAKYAEEFNDYKKGEDDMSAYYTQAIEKDARAYSETRTNEIIVKLYGYVY